MSNSKGNAYPLWIISNNYQIQSVGSDQTVTNQSNENFASEIGISEDGTVWVLSLEPDPDGGGAKVFWSNGDNNWNEIATSDPGGVRICGYTGSSCLIITGQGQVLNIDTDGSSTVIYDESTSNGYLAEMDYANGKVWGMIATAEGKVPTLHYADASSNLSWTEVGEDVYNLYGISAGIDGRCYSTEDYKPVYYDTDGTNGSAGDFGAHLALSISVKTGNFVMSGQGNADGNLVYEWTIENEGSYSAMSIRAMRICATYYTS